MTDAKIVDFDEEKYHAFPAVHSSMLHTLAEQTPAHAFEACRWLNPAWEPPKGEEKFDPGKYAHKLKTGKGAELLEVPFPDWRKADAKAMRTAAHEAGKIPLLTHQREAVEAMVEASRRWIGAHRLAESLFCNGDGEVTILWEEQGIPAKCRLDWLPWDRRCFIDDKNTKTSVHPDNFIKHAYNMGYDIQLAWYLRGLNALDPEGAPGRRGYIFAQETNAPYVCSVITLDNHALDLADQKIDFALSLYTDCKERGSWPGYPSRPVAMQAPGYHAHLWENRLEGGGGYILSQAYRDSLMIHRPLELKKDV